jgi:hypothetical protein
MDGKGLWRVVKSVIKRAEQLGMKPVPVAALKMVFKFSWLEFIS